MRDFDRGEAVPELAKLAFELGNLPLLPVDLVAELEIRVILLCNARLDVLEPRIEAPIP